ncbi:MAG: glycosyltransferase family 9 protein [Syntrophobacteraceae bacterium]|nr:glycosyltransferase family 9 protein [Syntrophobacteraceae bacterium]
MPEGRGVIVHQGALGDFLLALPVIEGIVRASPPILKLDFWSRPSYLSLLHGKPYVGSIHDAGGREWIPFFQDDRADAVPLPQGLEEARWVLIFGQASSARAAERLRGRMRAPAYWLKSFPDEPENRHTTDFIADQARALGLPLVMEPLRLASDPLQVMAVRERLLTSERSARRQLVVVHPGSGGLRKIWPLSRWRMLLQWLCERREVRIVLVLGPADEKIRPFIGEVVACRGIPMVEDLELPAFAALLREADVYIGNDSGATHLAASMGTPAVAVFGPTNPAVWGPRGDHVTVFKDSWNIDEVLEPRISEAGSRSASALASIVAAKLTEGRGPR